MIEYRAELLSNFLAFLNHFIQLLWLEIARIQPTVINIESLAAKVSSEPAQVICFRRFGVLCFWRLDGNSIVLGGTLDDAIAQQHQLVAIRKLKVKHWFQLFEA